ncbi:hypothetical protein M422DRAFT_259148 [Sphaerobolus stellatus SS14]|uniref:Uncharacterized protein n=1 Tax=Sphaerobolus stellatus (strain SS14) TaxID=990650 RepID=A0A0C9U5H2_SPHS4|nr:hypothetical protein M422DRAFT_259148 [Sphaerobolus stellatus SS14]
MPNWWCLNTALKGGPCDATFIDLLAKIISQTSGTEGKALHFSSQLLDLLLYHCAKRPNDPLEEVTVDCLWIVKREVKKVMNTPRPQEKLWLFPVLIWGIWVLGMIDTVAAQITLQVLKRQEDRDSQEYPESYTPAEVLDALMEVWKLMKEYMVTLLPTLLLTGSIQSVDHFLGDETNDHGLLLLRRIKDLMASKLLYDTNDVTIEGWKGELKCYLDRAEEDIIWIDGAGKILLLP